MACFCWCLEWSGKFERGELRQGERKVEIWSDASGSWGCRAVWGGEWLQIAWCEWPGFKVSTIAAKELLPVVVAMATWGGGGGPSWRGKVVLCHCDN